MENASKALLIAAEVLIAILVASMFSLLFSTMSDYSRSYETTRETQEIQAFNAKFTGHIKGGKATAQDIITLKHLAEEWNDANELSSGDNSYIDIEVDRTSINNMSLVDEELFLEQNSTNGNQMKYYELDGNIEYSNVGRIKKIPFKPE